ncbi:kinase-like domain-containing protein [Rhizophagus irregularis DAOM 181602=DAOM 197198]|nr:kinase-like domain-containing protein [Rhizophagus irregularis DAOM 181602=DAOM 197198]
MNKYQKKKIKDKTNNTEPFVKFGPLIKDVTEIHIKVTDIYHTTQHYKNIIKNFMERISMANSAVNILQKRKELIISNHYYTSLRRLVQVLQNMIKFVKETQYNESLKEEDKILKEDIEEFLKFQTASMINTIVKILDEVKELCKKAQHNKKIAGILTKRISKVIPLIKIIQQKDELFTSHYEDSHNNLRRLILQVPQNMKKYIEEITQYDTMQELLETETFEKKFKELRNEYNDIVKISLLNFNINFDFKINEQEDDKILLTDLVKSRIAKIFNEVKELYKIAQHNKNITFNLIKRMFEAYFAVIQANKDLDTSHLQRLFQVFKEMKKYIEEITQYNTVQDFLKDKIIEYKFKDLREEYNNTCIDLLNFDNCKKFKEQDEDKILKEDIKELIKFQTILAESITGMNMKQISEINNTIYFELFFPLIKDVASIFNRSMDLYHKVQHKKITKILIDRITKATNTVNIYILQDTDDNLYTSKNHVNLQRLVQVLQDMKNFIAEELTQNNLLIESVKSKIIELCNEYDTCISLLMINPKVNLESKNLNDEFQEALTESIIELFEYNMNQNITDTNDEMNKIIKMVINMHSLIDNKKGIRFNEFPLPYYNYIMSDDKPRSDKLRKYINRINGDEVAFKTVKENHIIVQVENQVTILKKLEYCQNIIQFYGLTYDGSKFYLITEWAENGNLRKYISLYGQNIEIKFRLKFAYDIAKGLNFLNSVKILHQNISSENIVITNHDVAKLTNFQLANNLFKDKKYIQYSSPEMLEVNKEKEYNTKCEIYSYGILLWEIAECKVPYAEFENPDIIKKVIKGYREKFTPDTNIPKEYQILVKKAVKQNPDYRPTFAKLLIGLQDIFNNYISIRKDLLWIKSAIKEKAIKYIEWNELTDLSKVGSGHFGSVSKARWSKINDFIVIKKLNNSNDIQEDAFQHEIQMQNRVHACENIIRFIGITQELQSQNNYCIVMEYADSGNLRVYLKKNFSFLNWNKKYQFAFDITNGVHYLHKEKIIHRDLHAKNIVIHKGKAKITDFGYAKSMETQTKIHTEIFGMIPYVAPELLKHKGSQLPPFSWKTDIYSLGVLLWELSSGYPPFENTDEILLPIHIICNKKREEKIPDTPSDYYNLYTACWNENPEERPTIEIIYNKLLQLSNINTEDLLLYDINNDVKDSSSNNLQFSNSLNSLEIIKHS